MEVTQFTYFQQVGGIDCKPITGEITYGLERLAMYLQGVDNVFKLQWTEGLTYGDVYHQNEVEQSTYNFEKSDVEFLLGAFAAHERQAQALMAEQLALPAYEQVLKAAHSFNLLDARGAISVTERAAYIGRIRDARHAASRRAISTAARGSAFRWRPRPGPTRSIAQLQAKKLAADTQAAGLMATAQSARCSSSCSSRSCRRRRCRSWRRRSRGGIVDGLVAHGLAGAAARLDRFATPRRLAVLVAGRRRRAARIAPSRTS